MIDELDRQMIDLLSIDGRRSLTSLAKQLGISETAARVRFLKLQQDRTVTIVALCNALLLGHQVVRLLVRVRNLAPRTVAEGLAAIGEINHVAVVAGSHDLLLAATCRDQEALVALLDAVRQQPGVASMQPLVLTAVVKDFSSRGLRGAVGQEAGRVDR